MPRKQFAKPGQVRVIKSHYVSDRRGATADAEKWWPIIKELGIKAD